MKTIIQEGITAYFDDIKELHKKIFELKNAAELKGPQYKRIAMPALYALREQIAYFCYSSLSSKRRFKTLLTNYSGQKNELEKIDIVFLYQWDCSEQANPDYKKTYRKIEKIHPQIKAALVEIYGEEENIHIHMRTDERLEKKMIFTDKY